MSLFNILVRIGADTAEIESGLDRVDKRLRAFGDSFQRIKEVLLESAIADLGKEMIDLGNRIDVASKRIGTSVEAFQELSYAAKQSGVGADELTQAMVRMEKSLSDASTGAKKPLDALRALGLTISELKALAPDQQFEILADRISKLVDPADRARAEIDLFGRSGGQLGALFSQGAAGIQKARQELKDIGGVLSDETVKALEDAHKSIDRLESSFSGLAASLTAKVAPALTGFLDNLTSIISGDELATLKSQIGFLERLKGEGYVGFGGNLGVGYFSPSDVQKKIQELQNKIAKLAGDKALTDPYRNGYLAASNSENLGSSPGYQPDPLDALQPIHTNLLKLHNGTYPTSPFTAQSQAQLDQARSILDAYTKAYGQGVNPAVAAFVEQINKDADPAAAEYHKTLAQLNGSLQDNAISQEVYNSALAVAQSKFDESRNQLQEFTVTLKKLPDILTEIEEGARAFSDDIETALKNASQESGSLGRNILTNLLNAFENRLLFKAIDELGAHIEQTLSQSTSPFAQLIGVLFGGGGGSGYTFDEKSNFDNIGAALDASFGGGKAGGGPIESGKWYMAGEHGEEPIWGGGPGAFAMGYGKGGSSGNITVAPVYNIDARGATTDLVKALPGIMKQNNDALEYQIVTKLRRQAYAGF